MIPVNQSRALRGQPRDRKGIALEVDRGAHVPSHAASRDATTSETGSEKVRLTWEITEGVAVLDRVHGEIVTVLAPEEPQLVKLRVTARQGESETSEEAIITITDSLMPERPKSDRQQGLPDYTFQKAPGELWRSRYEPPQNLVIVNSGHRDFVYAARQKSLKLRYLCRLFAKELVLQNFPGCRADELLERMIELSLYTEEKLR